MQIGRIYDEVARDYDREPFGILAGGRALAAAQLERERAALAPVRAIVDLALGTGESLLDARRVFPEARLVGFDISQGMIDVAREKLDVEAHLADALTVDSRLPPGGADLVLLHFVTTYLDARAACAKARVVLRPGGHVSLVSGTMDSFRALQRLALHFVSEARLQAAFPAPESTAALEAVLAELGYAVRVSQDYRKPVRFSTFDEFHDFGNRFGFFKHAFEAVGPQTLETIRNTPGVFPLEDEYRAAVILAARR